MLSQAENEHTLRALADECEGVFGTMQQAIDELGIPRIKPVRPTPSYKGQLTIGNPDEYDSAMVVDVERYPRVMIRKPQTASNFVQRAGSINGTGSEQSSTTILPDAHEADMEITNDLTGVHQQRTYHVTDESALGGRRDVQREDLAKGYEYGRTAVHISESDQNVTKLETQASLDVIGFVPWSNVCPSIPFRSLC